MGCGLGASLQEHTQTSQLYFCSSAISRFPEDEAGDPIHERTLVGMSLHELYSISGIFQVCVAFCIHLSTRTCRLKSFSHRRSRHQHISLKLWGLWMRLVKSPHKIWCELWCKKNIFLGFPCTLNQKIPTVRERNALWIHIVLISYARRSFLNS